MATNLPSWLTPVTAILNGLALRDGVDRFEI